MRLACHTKKYKITGEICQPRRHIYQLKVISRELVTTEVVLLAQMSQITKCVGGGGGGGGVGMQKVRHSLEINATLKWRGYVFIGTACCMKLISKLAH